LSANCEPGNYRKAQCLAITGTYGGEGACNFVNNRARPNYKKCVNNPMFVDAPAPEAACSSGNFRRKVCEAITGPNGGEGACKYKTNENKANFRQCIANKNFVDNEPVSTCPEGIGGYSFTPFLRQTDNEFRIDRTGATVVDDCATYCSSLDACEFFTFRQTALLCDTFSATPPELSLTRNKFFDAYAKRANCAPQQ
jgi:hypothetical protein